MPKITVENAEIAVTSLTTLVLQIKALMTQAQAAVAQEVNAYNLKTYWEIGRIIVEYEQKVMSKRNMGLNYSKTCQNGLLMTLAGDFRSQTCSLCGGSFLNIQFNRHCLLNCHGRITVNF
ncbi:hypothetical protein AGMMS50230_18280 [Spirochaetia bacterium]|nr:hypothetical protein AGMMS50230_18280 [Spirochaetia bacterium]